DRALDADEIGLADLLAERRPLRLLLRRDHLRVGAAVLVPHLEVQRRAAAAAHRVRELLPRRDVLALDRGDGIATRQAGLAGGHVLDDAADLGEIARRARAVEREHERESDEGG